MTDRSSWRHRAMNRRTLLKATASGAVLAATAGQNLSEMFIARADAAAVSDAPTTGAGDVVLWQTAVIDEEVAIGFYEYALTLPFIAGPGSIGFVKAFFTSSLAHHREHAKAGADALASNPPAQASAPSPLAAIVEQAKPGLSDIAAVLVVAQQVETTLGRMYVQNVAITQDLAVRRMMASMMGVDAQHSAVIHLMSTLVPNTTSLLALPPDVTALPASVGAVTFPTAFFSSSTGSAS